MNLPQLADDAVQLTLLAPCRHANLVAGPLAQHFGLSLAAAEALLTFGRGVIAPRIRAQDARLAMDLLKALGVHVAIGPVGALPEAEKFDLSLRAAEHAVGELTSALAGFGIDATNFGGPEGHVLTGLAQSKAEEMAASLRTIPDVQTISSAQSSAQFDLFAPVTSKCPDLSFVRRHLVHLGCGDTGPSAALATGLDRRMLSHILNRFPGLGLFGVNQAFQRFDLTLTGPGLLTPREFQDFLATRAQCGGWQRLETAAGRGIRIETGLPRAAALQFLADYATIGIPARADLIRV